MQLLRTLMMPFETVRTFHVFVCRRNSLIVNRDYIHPAELRLRFDQGVGINSSNYKCT